jgi:NADPH:quinone reductase-like Zn-dependent oxidoreductase
MHENIPTTMRAIIIERYGRDAIDAVRGLRVVERPVPQPKAGQVLVRIEAAPCNPSDLLFLQGKYGVLRNPPSTPGWEGAGTVVASGGGVVAWWMNGKRVACAVQGDHDGTWAEYCVANVTDCIPLKRHIKFTQAASLIINPLTAVGLAETAQREGHRAAIATAAASQVGKMLLPIAREAQLPLISIVRREAQVAALRELGAEHVLNSTSENFLKEFKALAEKLRATALFEAIAGETTGDLLNVMPPQSCAYLYGALSQEPCGNFDPIQIIFHDKQLSSFYLSRWIKQRGFLKVASAANRVQKMLIDGRIETTVQKRVSLEDAAAGLEQYVEQMSGGKVLICPRKQAT